MACDTQINSLQFLRNKQITNDVNKILDESKFDEMNYKLTRLAEAKYGLTPGGLLFNKLEAKQWDRYRSSYMRDAKYTIKFAEANSTLFDELDRLVKEYETAKPDVQAVEDSQKIDIKEGVSELFESNPELANAVYEALGFKTNITQDNKSYYRGQIEQPTIDKNGNLVLYAREDELYKRANLPSKGVSMTDDLQSAIEYGNGQLEVAQNLASESYDAEQELERLSNNGYYLIQIPKDISNKIVKEAGEVKVVGDKIVIPKGQYKIEQIIDGVETQITPQQKQQAEQLYSEYIKQTGKQDIEGFKNFVRGSAQFMRESKSQKTLLASTLYEVNPNITEDEIKKIYDNYKALMNIARADKEIPYDTFKSLIRAYQVYNYKDTYIFGNWDTANGVFVTRLNSSPSSKELLAEAIPNLVAKGLDFMSFVPEDVAKKYERSGYTISKNSFDFNFKGEDMKKYTAVSNPEIALKVFGKPLDEVSAEELEKYNNSFSIKYVPLSIDTDLIEQAGNDVSKILETYLSHFGITVKDISEMKKRVGIDELGFADILSKIAYVKDKKDLPAIAGEFIAYMMQHNSLVKDIILELSKTNDYKGLNKSQYFKIIGQLIAEDLQNKVNNEQPKSLISLIKQLIKKFFKMIKDVDFKKINTNIGTISNNILVQNKNLVTASLYKPGAIGKPTKQVSIEDALKKDKFGAKIIYALAKKGFILTGSTALSQQGTIKRPDENPLHDIDWVSPFSREETESLFREVYPDAIKVREIKEEGSNSITDSFLITPEGYSIKDLNIENYTDNSGKQKTVIKSYSVVNSKGEVEGVYLNSSDGEIASGVEAKVIDFFTYTNYEKENRYPNFEYQSQEGTIIKLANWKDTFAAKLRYARYKDIWDYNRFIPYASQVTKEDYIRSGERANMSGDILTSNELTDKTIWEELVKDNKAFRTNDGVYIYTNDTFARKMPDLSQIQNERAKEIADILANRLSQSMGVNYEQITAQEAQDLLKYTSTGYNGETAFYFAGTVYFVGNTITLNTVLHEFSHPLIAAVRRDNPSLFNKLYSKLLKSTEGQRLYDQVKANYPELEENSPLFMEEVLTYALQHKAYTKYTNEPTTEEYNGFIKNMLYAIKQFLKKLFGAKANVAKLDLDTTLEDLAEMLLTKDFVFSTPDVTEQDVAQYARFAESRVKVITEGVSSKALNQVINSMYSINLGILEKASKFKKGTKEQEMLYKSLFLDEKEKQLIPAIQRSLAGYQTIQNKNAFSVDEIVQDSVQAEAQRLKDLNNRATSLVTSLDIIKNVTENMTEDLRKLSKSDNFMTREGIMMLATYKATSRAYAQLMNSIDKIFDEDFGLSTDNPFSNLLNSINQDITRIENLVRGMYSRNNVSFYTELTGSMNEFVENELRTNLGNALKSVLSETEIEDLYNKIVQQRLEKDDLDQLVNKGVAIKYINEFIDKYNYFLVSPEKIKQIISGNTRDVGFLNRFIESYSSSNDPIVGSLAMWIQDQKTDAQQAALSKSHKLRVKLEELLPKVGFSPLDTAKIANLTTFKDKKLGFDKDGNPVVREVMVFQNEFKDYRYDYDLMDYELEKAIESGDTEKIKEAAYNFRKLKKDYFWDKYKPEVYEKDDIFEKSPIGKLAWLDRKLALDEFNAETNKLNDEFERFEKYSSTQALWRKYQQLYALTYEDGSPKIDDPENNIYDLSKAMILREHREATRKYYEFVEKPGALQTAYNQFVTLLEAQGVQRDTEEYQTKLKQWIKQNTRVAYSPKFYESRGELISRLKELQEKMNATFDMGAAYQDIYDVIFVFKDEQGQPIPEDLGADRLKKVKDIQQKILDFKFTFDQGTGLTKDEAAELQTYMNLISQGIELTEPELKQRFAELIDKQESNGLSGSEIQEMNDIIAELSDISRKIPTEYYMDIMNDYMSMMQIPQLDEDDVDDFINSSEMAGILETNPKFSKWFLDNHVVKRYYNKYGKIETKFERSPAYSISVPTDPDHFLETKVIDNETGDEITIPGLPNARHSVYRVKNEYRTIPAEEDWTNYIGIYVDNQGNYLPRKYTPGQANSAVDNKYINEDYLRMNKDSAEFKLIEALKEYSLSVQEGKSKNSKLYLDAPRYSSRDVLEAFQGGEYGQRFKDFKGKLEGWWNRTVRRSADDFENNMNYDPNNNLVNTTLNGDEVAYIPVTGLYNLDYDKTSKDVLGGLIRYTSSLETQSKLIETLPYVNAVLEDLQDPANQPKNTEKKTLDRLTGLIKNPNKKGATNHRAGQVQSLIDREYFGVNVSDFDQNNPVISKFMGSLQRLSGRASLAVNIPAALKNRYGQVVQNIIEAAGGEYITLKDLALARPWAFKMMTEWSAKGIYATGAQSLQVQMLMAFDPTFRSKEMGRSINRHLFKDLLNGSWMMDVNKFGEMEAALQLFGGFMYNQKVELKSSKGESTMIRYMDAWELDSNKELVLKPGIDPEWSNKKITHEFVKGEKLSDIAKRYGLTVEELKAKNKLTAEPEDGKVLVISNASKFKQFKNRFQGVSRRLYGAYDDFGTPEGNKLLLHRLFFFMRKWAVPMFTNRLGASLDMSDGILKSKLMPRYDWALGKPTQGYYITTLQFMKEAIMSKGKKFKYMTEQEKVDLKRTGTEALFIIGLSLAAALIFGYDDDDEDRWKKLQAKSGALFTDEFKPGGFMANHLLYLTLGVQSETSTFIPISKVGDVNFGLDDYTKFLTGSSVAFGNTLVLYGQLMQDVLNFVTFNDAARYKREAGPYWFQEKDELKVWGHIFKAFGYTGTTGNPETLIKNLERSGTVK